MILFISDYYGPIENDQRKWGKNYMGSIEEVKVERYAQE